MQSYNIYLYAVVPRTHDGAYYPHGVNGFPVSLHSCGDLTAVISFVPAEAELGDKPAHRRVMQRLLAHESVLPAPEPTILPDLAALAALLSQQQRPMLAQLHRFSGLVEVTLHVVKRSAAVPVELEQERAYLRARFSTTLRSSGFFIQPQRQTQLGAQDALRFACLVPQVSLACFTLTCESLGERLDPDYVLTVSSPMAPVDFVDAGLFSRPGRASVPRTTAPLSILSVPPVSVGQLLRVG